LIVALMMIAPATLAQTSTPTLIPGALVEGLYRFIDLTHPSISLSGSWVVSGSVLQTTTNGASVTIPVRGAWAIISISPAGSESYEICIPSCTTYNAPTGAYPGIAISINTQTSITIRKLAGTYLRLDRVWVMQGAVAPYDAAAFGTPAPAPSPYVIFVPVAVTAVISPTPTPTETSTPTQTPTPTETPVLSPTPTATETPIALSRRYVDVVAYNAEGTPIPIKAEERYLVTSGDQQISALLIGLLILSGVSIVVQLWRR